MISVAMRSTSLSSALKSTSQVVASSIKGVEPSVILKKSKPCASVLDSDTVLNGNLKVSSGIGVSTQVKYYHREINVPDFSSYRKPSTKDPNVRSKDKHAHRNSFIYLVSLGNFIGGAYVAKGAVRTFVSSMDAAADVVAAGKIEIKLADIPEGKSMTFKWRGKPVFVRHRTDVEIAREKAVDLSSLRDPQTDEQRVTDPKFLVVIGICTHLGCVPIANAGDFFGYYCPCHGSHYDACGRIRKGPAPFNLEVPEHYYNEPGILQLGS